MKSQEIADTLNEIRFLSSVRHPYIVGFLEAFLDRSDTELCIVMEYCSYGDLAEKVERYKKRRQYIDEKVIWAYLVQCLEALTHLHSKKICHRDLKPANCFLCDDGTIKIGDMNVSKRMKHGLLKTQIGTPYYMSPEIWSNKPYNETSDMWALGCLIYELCALRPPFLGDSFPQLKRAVLQGRYNSIPRCYSYEMSTVISKLLRTSPRNRPSAKDLLASPEVQKYMKPGGYGSVAPESHRPIDLMETIKAPHGPKRRISAVLPKPCYPDTRPASPESWPMSARDRKEAINRKNGGGRDREGGLESVSEDSENCHGNNNNQKSEQPKKQSAPSPLPIRAKGGSADVRKDARVEADHHSYANKKVTERNQRKALAPIDKNKPDDRQSGASKPPLPQRSNQSHQNNHRAGARPSRAVYHRADKQEVKPHRPGREPSKASAASAANGRRPQYRNAANVYGNQNNNGVPNYRRGQYSYKPSWWG